MTAVRTRWLVGTVVVLVVAGVAWVTLGLGPRRTAPTSGRPAGIREGGTVTFAAADEPTGFNPDTSTDASPWVQNVVENVYPSVFRTLPDLPVQLDGDLMDSAELTSQRPQTVTDRIRRDAVWSDGVPISAADFAYLWRRSNGADKRLPGVSSRVLGNRNWLTGQPAYEDHSGDYGRGDIAAASRLLQQAGWARAPTASGPSGARSYGCGFDHRPGPAAHAARTAPGPAQEGRHRLETHNARFGELFGDRLPHGNFDLVAFAPASRPPSWADLVGRDGSMAAAESKAQSHQMWR